MCEWVFELTVCELSLSLIFCLCKCGSVTVSDSAYVCLRVSVFVYLCVYKKRVRENLSHPLWKARKTDWCDCQVLIQTADKILTDKPMRYKTHFKHRWKSLRINNLVNNFFMYISKYVLFPQSPINFENLIKNINSELVTYLVSLNAWISKLHIFKRFLYVVKIRFASYLKKTKFWLSFLG